MKHGGCEKTPWKQCGCETCANDVKHGFVNGWGSAPMNTPYGWSCSAPFNLDPSLALEMNGKHQQVENTLAVPSTPYVTRSSSLCLGLTNLVTPWKGHSEGCTILLSVFWGFLKRRAPTPSKVGNTFHAKTHGLEVG